MDSEEDIFLRAVEFPTAEGRIAFLEDACGGDLRLRADVESLLTHHNVAGNFLEVPPAEVKRTLGARDGDTVDNGSHHRLLELLAPCDKPGCLGRLGPYEVMAVLGRGGMGVVVRARDPKLNRDVAIKLLAAAGTPSPGAVQRLVREAQAAAAVKHDHVVTIHAINDDGPIPYIVMELVEGISLQQTIDQIGALAPGEILRIGGQIAAALEAAHQRGLVHRDIKPANILLESGTKRVKITDFGLARAVDDGHLSRDGQIAGTPQFMSPEQAQGRKADQRSDLFSLGSVLYTMCTGLPAFPAETAVAALRGICDDAPRPIREVNPDIPPWLDEIISRLMQKNPDKRPQSAREVADLLGCKPASVQSSPSAAAPAVQKGHPVRSGPNRWNLAALAGSAGIVLAGAIIVIVNMNGKSNRIEVPDGAKVKVTTEGVVEVDLPGTNPRQQPLPTLSVPEQVKDIAAELVKLNPDFDGQVTPTMENGQLIGLQFSVDQVKDISPIKSLTSLRALVCTGSQPESGRLADLSPLRGMSLQWLDCTNTPVTDLTPLQGMPLERLNCANAKVADLTPLKAMPLRELYLQGTQVADLSPLQGMRLRHLNCSFTRVTDLSPLRGMKLITFYCDSTKIANLSPLVDMPLKILHWRGHDQASQQHQEVVRSIPTLEVIDSLAAAEFWKGIEAKRKD